MKAFVSVISYVPHPARGEAVYVGAVVASPEVSYFEYELKLYGQMTRLRCFDPNVEEERIESHVEWLESYRELFREVSASSEREQSAVTVLEELSRVTSASRVHVGPFNPVYLEAPVGEPELAEILRDTIEREVRWYKYEEDEASAIPTFKSRVDDILQKENLYRPRSPHSPVKRNYELRRIGLAFDYGYVNGQTHVMEAADIRDVNSENGMVEKAASIIVKYRRLSQAATDGDFLTERITLLSGARQVGKATSQTIRELESVSDVYYLGEDQDRRRLIARIRDDLNPHLLGS